MQNGFPVPPPGNGKLNYVNGGVVLIRLFPIILFASSLCALRVYADDADLIPRNAVPAVLDRLHHCPALHVRPDDAEALHKVHLPQRLLFHVSL